ncbi:hypothetical protein [Actinoplanes aureus]|uniref:Uncharacterized protein n=1 Tax=Actinoplanes aureus TaxID=2792083 RepID=A0A931FZI5_9ACTN|nr:hypothetical protein [Actinoplanes aureus]MBG0563026.1 hypothetical protein [Actinoplanes aureus]
MRVFRTILGMLLLTIGLPALLAGGGLWALMQHRDPGGAFSGQIRQLAVPGYALVVPDVDRLLRDDAPFTRVGATRLRLSAVTLNGPAFVGLAPARDIERYLAGVPHTRVNAVDIGTGALPLTVGRVDGRTRPAGMPGRQPFWTTAGQGQLSWTPGELTGGPYSLVVMNPAAQPINKVASAAEVWPSWLNSSTWGLLTLGTLLVMASVTVLAWPGRRREVVYVVEPSQVPDLMQAIGAPLPLSGGGRQGGAHRPRTLADSRPSRPPALPQFSWPPQPAGKNTPELPPGGGAAPAAAPIALTSAPAGTTVTLADAPAAAPPAEVAPPIAHVLPAGAFTPAPGQPLNLLGDTPALAGMHPGPLPASRNERRRSPAPTDLPEFRATAVGAWVAATAPERARQTEARAAARLAEAAARKSAANTPPVQGGGRDTKPAGMPIAGPRKRVTGEQRTGEATPTEPTPAATSADAASDRAGKAGPQSAKPASVAGSVDAASVQAGKPGPQSAKPGSTVASADAANDRTGKPKPQSTSDGASADAADGQAGELAGGNADEAAGPQAGKPETRSIKPASGGMSADAADGEAAKPATGTPGEAAGAGGKLAGEAADSRPGKSAAAGGGRPEKSVGAAKGQAGKPAAAEHVAGPVSGPVEKPAQGAAQKAGGQAGKAARLTEGQLEPAVAGSPVGSEADGRRDVAGESRPESSGPAGKQRGPADESGAMPDGRPKPGDVVAELRPEGRGGAGAPTGARPSPRPQVTTQPSAGVSRIAMHTGPAATDWTATGLTRLGTGRTGSAKPQPQNPPAVPRPVAGPTQPSTASARPAAPAAQPPAASPQPGAVAERSNTATKSAVTTDQPTASAAPAAVNVRPEESGPQTEQAGTPTDAAVETAASGVEQPPVWPPVNPAGRTGQDAVSAGEPTSTDKTAGQPSSDGRDPAKPASMARPRSADLGAAPAGSKGGDSAKSVAAKSAAESVSAGKAGAQGRASMHAAESGRPPAGNPASGDAAAQPASAGSDAHPAGMTATSAQPPRASMHSVELDGPARTVPGQSKPGDAGRSGNGRKATGRADQADHPLSRAQNRIAGKTSRPSPMARRAPAAWIKAAETMAARAAQTTDEPTDAQLAAKPVDAPLAAMPVDVRVGADGQSAARVAADGQTTAQLAGKPANAQVAADAQPATQPAETPAPIAATPDSLRAARGSVPRPKAPASEVPPRVTKENRAAGRKDRAAESGATANRALSYREEAAELLAGTNERRRRRTVAGRPAERDRPQGEPDGN